MRLQNLQYGRLLIRQRRDGMAPETRPRRRAVNYDRLVDLKTSYNPGNPFRMNQNIKPRSSSVDVR